MTPKDFTREDFDAIMQPLPEIPPLGRMTCEGYERLVMRLEDRIKDLEAAQVENRLEALEEAATIADHLAENAGSDSDISHGKRIAATHIASAIRARKDKK